MKHYELLYDRQGNAVDRIEIARNILAVNKEIKLSWIAATFKIALEDVEELQREIAQEPKSKPTRGKPHLRLL